MGSEPYITAENLTMTGRKQGLDAKAKLEQLTKKKRTCADKVISNDGKKNDIDTKVEHFQKVYMSSTNGDILWEFETLCRLLPTSLLPQVKDKIISEVKQHLKVTTVNEIFRKTNIERTYSQHSLATPILDAISVLLGYSLTVIAPPTNICLYCQKTLTIHHDPIQVQLHTRLGTSIATKYSFRCRLCKQAMLHYQKKYGPPEDIYYHPTKFGNQKDGFKEYSVDKNVKIVRATDVAYFEDLFAPWLAESYNESNRGSYEEEHVKTFLRLNPSVGKRFQHKDVNDKDESSGEEDNCEQVKNNMSRMYKMNRKSLGQAMYNNEVKSELIERGKLEETMFGPMIINGNKVNFKKSRYEIMKETNEYRKAELYEHTVCHEGCQKRGCEKISTADGLWKINYTICMWDCTSSYPEEITEYIPQVCPEEPEHGSAFCKVHTKLVESFGR